MRYEVNTISWWEKVFYNFIDDCTRFCYVYLLNSKDEAIDTFKQYKNEVEKSIESKDKNDSV